MEVETLYSLFKRVTFPWRVLEGDGGGNNGGGAAGGGEAGAGQGSGGGQGGNGNNGNGSGTGSGGNGGQGAGAGNNGQAEMFSREYVHELREESKGHRIARETAEKDRDTYKSQLDEATARIERLTVGTAIESALSTAGALAPDLIIAAGLIDVSKIERTDDGKLKPESLGTAIEGVKKARPELFGTPKSGAGADAGARGGGSTTPGTMNDWIRGAAGR